MFLSSFRNVCTKFHGANFSLQTFLFMCSLHDVVHCRRPSSGSVWKQRSPLKAFGTCLQNAEQVRRNWVRKDSSADRTIKGLYSRSRPTVRCDIKSTHVFSRHRHFIRRNDSKICYKQNCEFSSLSSWRVTGNIDVVHDYETEIWEI
jgi:hypothetical protein